MSVVNNVTGDGVTTAVAVMVGSVVIVGNVVAVGSVIIVGCKTSVGLAKESLTDAVVLVADAIGVGI